ncbi:MAG: FAD-binding oxidoreductase [Aquabacterium sp.]
MAALLSALGLLALVFIAWLTFDGVRAIWCRWQAEQLGQPLRLRVARRDNVAGELMVLRLTPARGWRLPAFRAGQHVVLEAPAGPQGKVVRRAYSLAAWHNRPRHYELGIKREPGGAMSTWLWEHLRTGDRLTVSRPKGHFTLVNRAGGGLQVLIGGGIGITPMRAMLHEALHAGQSVHLFHAARTRGQLLYQAEFEQLASTHPNFAYTPALTRPEASWTGLSGRLDAECILATLREARADVRAADFYMCASNEMMAALQDGLVAQGVAADRVHLEAFGAAQNTDTQAYDITLHPSGQVLTFQGQPSLLVMLQEAGTGIDSDCRNGTCGACKVRCVTGEVRTVIQPEWTVTGREVLA